MKKVFCFLICYSVFYSANAGSTMEKQVENSLIVEFDQNSPSECAAQSREIVLAAADAWGEDHNSNSEYMDLYMGLYTDCLER